MAVTLTGAGGLFTRLGKIGKLALVVNTHQSGLPANLEALYAQYDGLTPPGLRDVIADAIALNRAVVADAGRWLPVLQTAAQLTLLRMVREQADNPAAAQSVEASVAEVRRQMLATAQTVERSVVSVTPTAFSGMGGTGVVVATATRGDGLPAELIFPETGRLVCSADSFGDGATAGNEPFTYFGEDYDPADVWAYDWGSGTRAQAGYTAVSPDSGSVLANGDFEDFAVANTPDQWVIQAGAAGTEVLKDVTNFYDGASSVRFVGSATNTALTQQFGVSTGTAEVPAGLVPYAVALWVRIATVPAAGVLTVELIDGANAVVNDAQGAANSFTRDLTTLVNNTWTSVTGVFRLPKVLPAVLKIRLRLSTALSAGSNLNIDRLSVAQTAAPYPGGPGLAVFSGATPFANGDGWQVTGANNRGGASFNATFQALWDRLFGMRDMGQVLPSATAGAETIADTLITA